MVALDAIRTQVTRGINDARWLRERFAETKSLSDVVRLQAMRWKESEEAVIGA